MRYRLRRRPAVLGGLLLAATLGVAGCTSSHADGRPSSEGPTSSGAAGSTTATTWVVSVGDSYISGEGTRWAGNTGGPATAVDAQGPRAYWDTSQGESIPGCHRARQSIGDVGGSYRAINLACSGAQTATVVGPPFKPGIDFFKGAHGRIGQALALQRFAASHPVSTVVMSIGGNDFGFGNLVAQCVGGFVSTTSAKPALCSKNPTVAATFDAANVATIRDKISTAIVAVAGAMQKAGYQRDDYSIVVLNYPDPLPASSGIRYPQTQAARGVVGGCPVFDADADWAARTVVPAIDGAVRDAVADVGLSNLGLLDVSHALDGHRLCEKGVGQLTDTSSSSWEAPGAAAALEWVNMVYTKGAPWQLQESFHPNYFGMLAERSCLAQALATTPPTYGSCEPGSVQAGTPMVRLLPQHRGPRPSVVAVVG